MSDKQIDENLPVGSTVARVSATDIDFGVDGDIASYIITAGSFSASYDKYKLW